jgi:probable rRNA maturation factor
MLPGEPTMNKCSFVLIINAYDFRKMPSSKTPPIHFHFLQPFSLPDRLRLKAFIAGIFKKEKIALEGASYIFCSDEYLLDINRRFLQHDYFTDIITFNLAENGQPVNAEIYISTDRVKDNAQSLKVPVKEEILRVMFHGVLHCCGYKDKTRGQASEMRKREAYYLKKYLG